MSVSGPCIWLSSLPPPSSSHLTAITNSWSTPSWNVEQATSRTKAVSPGLPRSLEKESDSAKTPVDMQSAAIKAENAFSAGAPVGPSNSVRYSGVEMPSDTSGNRNVQAEGDASLSRMKLERLNHSEPLLSIPRGGSSPQAPRELTPEARTGDQEEQNEHDNNAEVGASSDDGTGSPRTALDPKTEKKKMKRFRLTHNQTRFLMSEFTRQAHPDAAHRERLSREIPGLTPRQVQVWFQNRRAKLKRLTSNDRERMLKSRALPEDFDTTQVLRTPFDNRTSSETPVPSPLGRMASISGANVSKMLMTDGLPRLNDDDYVISPLSSASTTTGSGFPSTGTDRNLEGYMPNGTLANRAAPTPIPELQRHNRSAFPFSRSSSFSEPSFNPSLHFPGRYSRPGEPVSHPGMSYGRRPVDYGISRPGNNSMVVGYDGHRQLEGSVSPTGQTDQPIAYSMDGNSQQLHSYQPSLTMPASKGFGGLDLSSHIQSQGRHIPALQSLPVSDAPDYRHYSYSHHPYSMSTAMPYTQANASSMSLPASFPSDTGSASHGSVGGSTEDRINNPPQLLDPLRTNDNSQWFILLPPVAKPPATDPAFAQPKPSAPAARRALFIALATRLLPKILSLGLGAHVGLAQLDNVHANAHQVRTIPYRARLAHVVKGLLAEAIDAAVESFETDFTSRFRS
ncbi:hypothetical protein BDV37DRAFT_283618 [Aspergillus pseudonomiae]|uniref:Homeobox domain-containing protein n=1 Tax=Aspergillus pseudonomiae TaxID=1506151 RepID=A0A5N7DAS5_9EURO|nr:uncharacterized protein BDV37DRAFT_283618 [Aspergillus pseudonomiae]KAE8403560.1 hypothetical protein BDV37DRAFT_283618 [Aspergillus pseudonomiae]